MDETIARRQIRSIRVEAGSLTWLKNAIPSRQQREHTLQRRHTRLEERWLQPRTKTRGSSKPIENKISCWGLARQKSKLTKYHRR